MLKAALLLTFLALNPQTGAKSQAAPPAVIKLEQNLALLAEMDAVKVKLNAMARYYDLSPRAAKGLIVGYYVLPWHYNGSGGLYLAGDPARIYLMNQRSFPYGGDGRCSMITIIYDPKRDQLRKFECNPSL